MKIYTPDSLKINELRPSDFVSNLDYSGINPADITSALDEIDKIEENNISQIENRFKTLASEKDGLLNINPGSSYGRDVLERKKQEYGIGEDLFKLQEKDLKDPMKTNKISFTLKAFFNDPEVNEVLKEAELMKRFEKTTIPQLERKNPAMAAVAKKDLLEIRNGVKDANGNIKTIYDISPEHYQDINFGKILQEELKALPTDTKVESTKDGSGYIIFSESKNFRMTGDEFAKAVAERYSDDPRVVNLFRSKVDPFKPKDQQLISDPDAVDKYLMDEARKAYDQFNNKGTKTFIKDDKVALQENRTQSSIALDEAKTQNKKELEAMKAANRLTYEKERRITKQVAPGGSGGGRKGSSAGTGEMYSVKDHGKFGASLGNDLEKNGYKTVESDVVILNKAFDAGDLLTPRGVKNSDGSVSYKYYDASGQEAAITFKKKGATSKPAAKPAVSATKSKDQIKKKWGK